MATYLHEARSDDRAHPPSAAQQPPSIERLRKGDTLVVSCLGSLGESYAEISQRMHDLMRHGVSVRAIYEGLTFDGSVEDVKAQASRDALIAVTAAAAESNRTAQRLATERQAIERMVRPEPMTRDVRTAILQLGTIGIQIGALAAAVYVIGFALPKPPPQAPRTRPEAAQKSHPPEPPRYSTKEFLIEKGPPKNDVKRNETTAALPQPTERTSDSQTEQRTARPVQRLGLSREEELRVFATVGDWRSARVKGAAFPIVAGTAVPPGIRLATFPRGLVRNEPALGGYKFVVAGQMVGVVDPQSRRIVATLSGPGARVE